MIYQMNKEQKESHGMVDAPPPPPGNPHPLTTLGGRRLIGWIRTAAAGSIVMFWFLDQTFTDFGTAHLGFQNKSLDPCLLHASYIHRTFR